jgi:predicted phage tail component-like protein
MEVTLGDKTLTELNLILAPGKEWAVAPSTKDYTLEIAGRHGAWDFGADLERLEFALPVTAMRKDAATLQQTLRDLTAHLFDSNGRPKTMKLIFEEESDKYYNVRYSGSLPVDRLLGIGEFTLPLVAFDPFSYAPSTAYDPVETYYYDSGLQYDDGLMYDNVAGFNWQYNKQYIGLYNYSATETPVKLVVRGKVINPRVTNQTTGETNTVSGLTDGELEIDTAQYYVKRTGKQKTGTYFLMGRFPADFYELSNDIEYIISGQNGDFTFLAPGKNSLLLEGGLPNALVDVIWEHRFL